MSFHAGDLLLSLKEVRFYRDKVPILDDITFQLRYGEIVTVIGPNGAGKTTLARLILKLLRASSGEIWTPDALRIGYVPQVLTLPQGLPLTAKRLLTLHRSYPEETVIATLKRCGVEYTLGRAIHTLSQGELQRVLLARCLLQAPDLLILDEPMQNIDITGQRDLYQLLGEIRRQCGILLISHDLHIVMSITTWVICLNRHICCAGTPSEVDADPSYADLFRVYRHRHSHHHDLDHSLKS